MHLSLEGILIIVLVVFCLVFGSIRLVIRRGKERVKTFNFSGPGVVKKPKQDEDENDSMSWEEIQENMKIGGHYAIYADSTLNEKELDIIFDHGWRLCTIDSDNGYCGYHFEKMS